MAVIEEEDAQAGPSGEPVLTTLQRGQHESVHLQAEG